MTCIATLLLLLLLVSTLLTIVLLPTATAIALLLMLLLLTSVVTSLLATPTIWRRSCSHTIVFKPSSGILLIARRRRQRQRTWASSARLSTHASTFIATFEVFGLSSTSVIRSVDATTQAFIVKIASASAEEAPQAATTALATDAELAECACHVVNARNW